MKLKKLLLCLGIPLAVGGLSALLSGGMERFDTLIKPPLSPPGWLFPVVWTILYLLMGYASYRVLASGGSATNKRRALTLYGAQLVLNFLWSPVFFGLGWLLAAFFILVALWIFIFITSNHFSQLDKIAGTLLLPYLLWVTFAGYLNFSFVMLN